VRLVLVLVQQALALVLVPGSTSSWCRPAPWLAALPT
jgi:hypothetical protein